MDSITKSIIDYINNENTLGALQIDGPWGCGKTFYVKNVLLSKIEENETSREETELKRGGKYEKRVPLMVSLFGLNTIDEIAKQLLFASTHSRYGFSAERIDGIKKSFSNIAKCVPYLKELDWDKVLQVPSSTCLRFLSEASIIILDDLERLSKEIDTEDVLGFVNDLIENYNFKVILISNQEKIGNSAIDFKEKVIEKTIPFRIDASSVIFEIANRFHPRLGEYLSTDYVARFLSAEDVDLEQSKVLSNLRTIRFALSQYAPIFSYYVDKDIPIAEVDDIVLSKLNLLWRFTLAISIEYRLGNISFGKMNDLENAGMKFILDRFLLDKEQTEEDKSEETYEDRFIKQYYHQYDIEYHYIPEIYEYIVTGKPLNLEKLDESVTKAIGIWKDATSEEVTFTTNFYDRVSSFSDADAPEEFAKYFDLISKGEVPYLCDILNAGNILFRYKEILGLDDRTISNGLIIGVDSIISKMSDEGLLGEEHKLQMFNDNIRTEVRECYEYIADKIHAIKQGKKDEYVRSLNKTFVENMEDFANEFIPKPIAPNVMSISSPILHHMDLTMVTQRVSEMNRAKDVENLNKMIYYRFGDNPEGRWTKEICFLEAIYEGLRASSENITTLSALFKRDVLLPRIKKLLKIE